MEITMEGRYAYRKEPNEEVTILTTNRPDPYGTVVSMAKSGTLKIHRSDGIAYPLSNDLYSLITYQPLVERWGVVSKGGTFVGSYADEPTAQDWAKHYCGRYFKMVEVR